MLAAQVDGTNLLIGRDRDEGRRFALEEVTRFRVSAGFTMSSISPRAARMSAMVASDPARAKGADTHILAPILNLRTVAPSKDNVVGKQILRPVAFEP